MSTGDKLTLRKNTIETLALLVDRYPNLTIAQILANAVGWDQADTRERGRLGPEPRRRADGAGVKPTIHHVHAIHCGGDRPMKNQNPFDDEKLAILRGAQVLCFALALMILAMASA
jgi:hypothetical protein